MGQGCGSPGGGVLMDKKVAPVMLLVKPEKVLANKWNPNRMDEEIFAKELLSIQTHGFIDPILIREVKGEDGKVYFEIVDGEHRWRAAGQLGLKEIPAVNLGVISDTQAKKLTILTNELRGSPEPVLLAELLKSLGEEVDLDQLAVELPMDRVEIESLIRAADAFDWDAGGDGGDPIGASHDLGGGTATCAFRIGRVKGEIPAALGDALLEEYGGSSRACGSRTPEVVLNHWLTRLRGALKETPEPGDGATYPPSPPALDRVVPAKKTRKRG